MNTQEKFLNGTKKIGKFFDNGQDEIFLQLFHKSLKKSNPDKFKVSTKSQKLKFANFSFFCEMYLKNFVTKWILKNTARAIKNIKIIVKKIMKIVEKSVKTSWNSHKNDWK